MTKKALSLRNIFLLSLATLIILTFTNWSLLQYGLMQGRGQFEVIWNAKPLEEVLNDQRFPDSLKQKISLIQEIRDFAIDSLGLNDSDSYKTIYDQKGKNILWNLSASEPFQLKSITWRFPLLGEFSYKGFFDYNKAKVEEAELKSQGFDTRIRPVNGWSTLGWFSDPILSNQLSRSDGSLAELIIHELTHATIFLKDSLEFNENLASFIGEQGAIKFLTSKYGIESNEMNRYVKSEEDYSKFTRHMLNGADKLDSLYHQISVDSLSIKQTKKRLMIQEIISTLDTVSFHNTNRFGQAFDEQLPNNAFFISFRRYFGKSDEFEGLMMNQFRGDLNAFIRFYKANQ